jgi:hypothetical protein
MYVWLPGQNKEVQANRAHMAQDLDYIFQVDKNGVAIKREDRPVVPGGLIPSMVDRLVSELFPGTISLGVSDEAYSELLSDVERQLNILKKCPSIAYEGAVTGTVGLKSIYDQVKKKWELDVLPYETLLLEYDTLNPEDVKQVTVRFKTIAMEAGQEVSYWHQERWTDSDYWVWPVERVAGKDSSGPGFNDTNYDKVNSKPHKYGFLPITVITHKYNIESPYGHAFITPALRQIDKAYTANIDGVAVADQFLSIPTMKRVNDRTKDRVYRIKVGSFYDVQSSDKDSPADIAPMTFPPTPESVFTSRTQLKAIAYELTQVINPDMERDMKAGGTQSSKAYRMFYKVFLNLVDTLRLQYGRDGVEFHMQKVLRMSKNLALPQYAALPDDIKVSIVYPPVFELDAMEKAQELGVIQQGNLPEADAAQRIAALFDITSQTVIDEIAANITANRAMAEPGALNNDPNV